MDARLNAHNDPMWMNAVLRADDIRNDHWRILAEAWQETPDRVGALLDQLAATVDQGGPAWDAAVLDIEADLQMDDAEVVLDEQQARQLAQELIAAADRTIAARLRETTPVAPIAFPHQQDRRHAA